MTDWDDLKDAPLSDTELQKVRLTVQRVEDAWPIIGPFVLAVRSWRAWLLAVVFFLWFNSPDIQAALKVIVGLKP